MSKFLPYATNIIMATALTMCATFVVDLVAMLVFYDYRENTALLLPLHVVNVAIGAAVAFAVYKYSQKNRLISH